MNVIKRVNVVVRDNARRPDLPDGVDFVVVEDGGDFMRVAVDERAVDNDEAVARDALRARADNALVDLRTLANSSGSLTNAQLSNAARLLARVCIALIRIVIMRLDGDD